MKLIRMSLLALLGLLAYGFLHRNSEGVDLEQKRLRNAANHAIEAAYEVTQWSADELRGLRLNADESNSMESGQEWNH
jgi:hypothetical protein